MSVQQVFKCDALNCEVTKGENNHWYLLIGEQGRFNVTAWTIGLAEGSTYLHCCGQECLHKMLDRWLQSGKLS